MGKPEVHQEDDPDSPCSETCSPHSSGRNGGELQYGGFKTVEGPDWSVAMRQSKRGFHCHALVKARLALPPDQAFDMLTDPVVKPWRHVKVSAHVGAGVENAWLG